MSSPWMKFYPSDWRADPALRVCSLAARGLWMEILCLMHEAAPRGSLLVNGQPVADRQLASLTGVSVRDVGKCLGELEAAGVFSREGNRTIYSRRMRRDDEKAERDKAIGKRGGNPTLKGRVNPEDKAQIPETRVQKPEREDLGARSRAPTKRGTRLADDWKPNEANSAYALESGLSQTQVDLEAEKFRNYWLGKSGQAATKVDWDATWRNWVLNALERTGKPNGQPTRSDRTAQAAGRGATGQDATLAGLGRIADRVRERGERERRDGEAAPGDVSAGQSDARLL